MSTSPADKVPAVGIIGAGISALIAARALASHGVDFWIIDKGRGVGGRMATRRNNSAIFDHGAQYFTARDPRFLEIVNEALAAGTLREWATGFRMGDGTLKSSGEPRYIGPNGFNGFAKSMAEGLRVELSIQATAIRHDGMSWVVKVKEAPPRRAHALLVTCPAPQSIVLLEAGNAQLPGDVAASLGAVQYDPCFALLLACKGPSSVPEPGGLWPTDGPFAWIADNRQKGISPDVTTLTFHTRPEFTREHLEDDRELLERDLMDAARPYISGRILSHQLHRWLYSIPTVVHPDRILASSEPGPIVFAGDGFGGPRVEGAALSGLAAADHLLDVLKNSS